MIKLFPLLTLAALGLLISTLCCCGALIGQETEAEEFISLSPEERHQHFGSTAPGTWSGLSATRGRPEGSCRSWRVSPLVRIIMMEVR